VDKKRPPPDFRRTFFKLWSLKVPSTNLLGQNHEKEAEVVKIEDSKKFQHQLTPKTPKVAREKQNKTSLEKSKTTTTKV
jgi:hypothetical protein